MNFRAYLRATHGQAVSRGMREAAKRRREERDPKQKNFDYYLSPPPREE